MKVLIACEYSGIIRDAWIKAGHDAMSCDFLPTERPGPHYQGSVLDILNDGFDLLIGHPPCTYLSYAGMCNWYDDGRAMKRIKAAEFFMQLYDSNIPMIAIENPRGIMSKIFREPDQEIHPYYFGEKIMKRTCLWLKNLPQLQYRLQDDLFSQATATTKPEPLKIEVRRKTGQKKNRYWMDTPGQPAFKNGHLRSVSFNSIAEAMVEQWGNLSSTQTKNLRLCPVTTSAL